MSNMILCQGAYAKKAYYASDDCRNLYSVEELCYYLYHNAYLLDDRFVSAELVDWIENELELPDLAKAVKRYAGRPDALTKLVCDLRDKIGYYDNDDWERLLGEIGRNNRLTVEERRKLRADAFLEEGKYALASDEYEVLLRETSLSQTKLRAKVYHNLGVCSAGLFMFRRAADYFGKAYETFPNTESYVSMLSAMKMYMSRKEYLDYLADHKESYEDSLEVERKMEVLKVDWPNQASKKFLDSLTSKREQGGAFYDGIESLSMNIKQQYKECVFRNRG